MWEIGTHWTDGVSNQMAIHVLLVDHETETLVNTVRLLECCHYRVTLVELASAAIQMLTSGKVKYDVVMANVNSPDLHGYKLVQHAVNMDIPVLLTSDDDNTFMAMKALENGAFLYVKKPVPAEMIGTLWQHVLREKTRMMKAQEKLAAANYHSRAIEFIETVNRDEGNLGNIGGSNAVFMMRDKGKSKTKTRDNFNRDGDHYDGDNNKLKRKVCTEWTQELHAKFMIAIEILGEGRCFPREILELMDVPGLTRMQVASHLQKCRNENWRTPDERKAMNHALGVGSSETGGSHPKPRRFGSMPKIGKANNGVELRSQTRSETDSGMHGNMGTEYVMENNITHLQVPGPFQPGPSRFSSIGKNTSDEFFNFPGMDSLIQDLSAIPQGFANPGQFHYNEAVYPEQNSVVASVDTASPWSSEKSNFGSNDSETRGHE